MAETLEPWSDRTPERHLFGRAPRFGLANDADRRLEGPAAGGPPAEPPRRRRERGPFLTYLSLPWSYSDQPGRDRWHRFQCRRGRHEMTGGHDQHIGGTIVYVERQCRWCAASPAI